MIRTVLGDLSAERVGHCQCHEHLFIQKGPSFCCNPALWMDDEEKTARELRAYREAGGALVVDAQPPFFGRMAQALVDASLTSGVHIVSVTGFHKLMFCEGGSLPLLGSEDVLASFFSTEVQEGMLAETGERLKARAGLIKAAVDTGEKADNIRYATLFHAAAQAAIQTGAPLIIHLDPGADALKTVAFFEACGVPARRLILCHLDRARYDLGYHREVLSTGVYLDYDSINRPKYVSNKQELGLILAMLQDGYAGQLLLSLDTTRARLIEYGGNMGLSYLLTDFLPQLRLAGIREEDIRRMTEKNVQDALQMM